MNQMPSIEESAEKAPAPTSPLRIAVLINDFAIQIEESFMRAINKACSSVSDSSTPFIDFFNPAKSQNHPEPAEYDLIVLSGGMVAPMGKDEWLLKLQEYIRKTVEHHPEQKILGLGWGHQVICVAFGGKVARLDEAEIGVRQMNLTAQGSRIFPFAIPKSRKIYIHEFHTREIRIPGHGFIPLAWGNKAFRNRANTILTLQGHPELDADSAKAVLDATIAPLELEEAQKAKFRKWMKREHDNMKVWESILAWVKE